MELSLVQRIEKWNEVHNNQYDYSKVEFVHQLVKIKVICKIHDEFLITPNNHYMGRGCSACGLIKRKKNFYNNKLTKRYENIIQPEFHKIIPLTKGKFALVDNEDFEKVKNILWIVNTWNYAFNSKHGAMHSFLLNPPKGKVVDHINGNGLDNRRSNIRICTQQQNLFNRSRNLKSASSFKGVIKHKKYNKWYSCIYHNSRRFYLGMYDSEIEAAKAYDLKAIECFGEFAKLNFPLDKAV